jgi:hypothetical protein
MDWDFNWDGVVAGKMGYHALRLGFISHLTIENGNGIKI